mmetsp:Transcript_84491/g.185440  ORF Transcript_84491/g.185440 Transcript_84491/m.185440 type:complete len:630 (-) Transcript_84491:168-2057(-)
MTTTSDTVMSFGDDLFEPTGIGNQTCQQSLAPYIPTHRQEECGPSPFPMMCMSIPQSFGVRGAQTQPDVQSNQGLLPYFQHQPVRHSLGFDVSSSLHPGSVAYPSTQRGWGTDTNVTMSQRGWSISDQNPGMGFGYSMVPSGFGSKGESTSEDPRNGSLTVSAEMSSNRSSSFSKHRTTARHWQSEGSRSHHGVTKQELVCLEEVFEFENKGCDHSCTFGVRSPMEMGCGEDISATTPRVQPLAAKDLLNRKGATGSRTKAKGNSSYNQIVGAIVKATGATPNLVQEVLGHSSKEPNTGTTSTSISRHGSGTSASMRRQFQQSQTREVGSSGSGSSGLQLPQLAEDQQLLHLEQQRIRRSDPDRWSSSTDPRQSASQSSGSNSGGSGSGPRGHNQSSGYDGDGSGQSSGNEPWAKDSSDGLTRDTNHRPRGDYITLCPELCTDSGPQLDRDTDVSGSALATEDCQSSVPEDISDPDLPSTVVVGPTDYAVAPMTFEGLWLPIEPDTGQKGGDQDATSAQKKVPIRSRGHQLFLSEALRLGNLRSPPLSFGSTLHVSWGDACSACRPCMFERWPGRCNKSWLCDFCHLHVGSPRRSRKRVPQGKKADSTHPGAVEMAPETVARSDQNRWQ